MPDGPVALERKRVVVAAVHRQPLREHMAAADKVDPVARGHEAQVRQVRVLHVGEEEGEPATVAKREAGHAEACDVDQREQLAPG